MTNYNFHAILKEVYEEKSVTPEIFEEIMSVYGLTTKDFESMKENVDEDSRVSNMIKEKLFKKENKNYHTISSKDNFSHLKKGSDSKAIVYQPLNDHSRTHLSAGDILFSYRTGQFPSLSEALDARGIYGIGMALSNPIKIANEYKIGSREEYKDYGVIVIYPCLLENHLSVRSIQLNPRTIDLTPYNGNRNDSLQYIESQEHYNSILGMMISENNHLIDFYKELGLTITAEPLPDSIWQNYKEKMNDSSAENNNYKDKFLKWAKDTIISAGEVELKTVTHYISGLNALEKEWNKENPTTPINLWNSPYYAKDQIGFDVIMNSKAVQILNKNQNSTQVLALNLYTRYLERPEKKLVHKGKNKIYFGAPGTGKSYKIKEFIKKNGISDYEDNIDDSNVFRVTLHPEFTYSDFVGQVMPDVITKGDNNNETQIVYRFVPQVFTVALKRAIKVSNEPVFLVLEEMSRSNVAAVFGDLFQLLDRNEEGESEYRVDNLLISREIYGEHSTKKIYLPNNLFIVGTVNTSDQNVFVMDTAFKRRFEYHYVNAQHVAKDKDGQVLNDVHFSFKEKQNKISFTWIDLYLNLNLFITKKIEKGGLGLTEDKQIGQFFIKFKKDDELYNYNQFKGKLIHYLWDDVQHIAFTDNTIFKSSINSFSELFTQVELEKNVFSEALLNQMNINLASVGVDEVDE